MDLLLFLQGFGAQWHLISSNFHNSDYFHIYVCWNMSYSDKSEYSIDYSDTVLLRKGLYIRLELSQALLRRKKRH